MNCLFMCDEDNKCKRTKLESGHYCWEHDKNISSIIDSLPRIKSEKLRRNPEAPTEEERKTMLTLFENIVALSEWGGRIYQERYGGYYWSNKNSIAEDVHQKLFYHEEPKNVSLMFRHKYPEIHPHIVRRPGLINSPESLKYLDPDSDIWERDIEYTQMDTKTFRPVKVKVDSSSKASRIKIGKQILSTIGQSFKIHLQPKPQYQYAVFERIFRIISQSKAFSRQLDGLKTIISYADVYSDRRLPAIVIYPVFGIEIATFILNVIVDAFEGVNDEKIGLGIKPRHNKKINNLIYVAGYEGGEKNIIRENYPGLIDKIFEEDYVFFKCPEDMKCKININT